MKNNKLLDTAYMYFGILLMILDYAALYFKHIEICEWASICIIAYAVFGIVISRKQYIKTIFLLRIVGLIGVLVIGRKISKYLMSYKSVLTYFNDIEILSTLSRLGGIAGAVILILAILILLIINLLLTLSYSMIYFMRLVKNKHIKLLTCIILILSQLILGVGSIVLICHYIKFDKDKDKDKLGEVDEDSIKDSIGDN